MSEIDSFLSEGPKVVASPTRAIQALDRAIDAAFAEGRPMGKRGVTRAEWQAWAGGAVIPLELVDELLLGQFIARRHSTYHLTPRGRTLLPGAVR